MTRCTSCDALLGPEADWCGQCYSAVPRTEAAQALPSIAPTPTPAPGVSPNGASASAAPPPRPATGEPPLPPDLLISLASRSSGSMGMLGRRGRNWITAFIVLIAVGTDAMFFPYAKYMVVYGVLVGGVSAFALWRLWSVRSVK